MVSIAMYVDVLKMSDFASWYHTNISEFIEYFKCLCLRLGNGGLVKMSPSGIGLVQEVNKFQVHGVFFRAQFLFLTLLQKSGNVDRRWWMKFVIEAVERRRIALLE